MGYTKANFLTLRMVRVESHLTMRWPKIITTMNIKQGIIPQLCSGQVRVNCSLAYRIIIKNAQVSPVIDVTVTKQRYRVACRIWLWMTTLIFKHTYQNSTPKCAKLCTRIAVALPLTWNGPKEWIELSRYCVLRHMHVSNPKYIRVHKKTA